MRYKIIFPTDSWLAGADVVALTDTSLDRAIGYARRMAEGDWWEVIDTETENVVASSESERE